MNRPEELIEDNLKAFMERHIEVPKPKENEKYKAMTKSELYIKMKYGTKKERKLAGIEYRRKNK